MKAQLEKTTEQQDPDQTYKCIHSIESIIEHPLSPPTAESKEIIIHEWIKPKSCFQMHKMKALH